MDNVTDVGVSRPNLRDIRTDMAGILVAHGWDDLAEELPDPDDLGPVRVAFVGPGKAGKSTLIAALTGDLSIKRSGKPETAVATRYPWHDGVELVDMPGWFSGFDEHDQAADEDLRRHADLVAFVMTVELGDELVVEAIKHVFGDLGFDGRAIVIVNKTESEDSDFEIIREEIERRLGEYATAVIVATDAQEYVHTIAGEFDLDEESVRVMQQSSGIAILEDTLNALVSAQGDTARASAQRLQVARVVDAAAERLVPTSEEQAATSYVDGVEKAITRARRRLDELATSHFDQMEAAISGLADDVLSGDLSTDKQVEAAWAEACRPSSDLAIAADKVIDDLDDDRDSVRAPFSVIVATPPSAKSRVQKDRSSPSLVKRLLDSSGLTTTKAASEVSTAAKKVADGGSRPGSIAHSAVKKLRPGKKYLPHGQRKDAAKIVGGAKAASKASQALPVIEELVKWGREVRELRRETKQAAGVRDRYEDLARSERRRAQADFDEWVSNELSPFDLELADGHDSLQQEAAARAAVLAQLEELRRALLERPGATGDIE